MVTEGTAELEGEVVVTEGIVPADGGVVTDGTAIDRQCSWKGGEAQQRGGNSCCSWRSGDRWHH